MKGFAAIGVVCLALGFPVRAENSWKAPASATKLQSPLSPNSKILESGRAIYDERCADCHGKTGKGNGPGASDLSKPPTNFRKSMAQSDGELFWKITEGQRPMPSYKKKLSEEQRWQVVHFIRTFAEKP